MAEVEWIAKDHGGYLSIEMQGSGTIIFIHGDKVIEVVPKGEQPKIVPFVICRFLAGTPRPKS